MNTKDYLSPYKANMKVFTNKFFKQKNSFYVIYKVSLLNGIPIESEKTPVICIRLWCVISFVVKIFMFVLSSAYLYKILPDYSTKIAAYVPRVCGYTIMLILIFHRQNFYTVTKNICRLSQVLLGSDAYIGSPNVKFELLALCLSLLVITTLQCVFAFYQEWDYYLTLIEVPFLEVTEYDEIYALTILFSAAFTYLTSAVMFVLVLQLSYNSFIALSNILKAYGNILKNHLSNRNYNEKDILQDFELFQEISSIVKEVDSALGFCILCLYVGAISGLLTPITLLFTQCENFRSLIARIYVFWTFSICLALFIILTWNGIKVHMEGNHLKQIIADHFINVAKKKPNEGKLRTFTLFADNIKNSNLAITGWGMFVIDKGLILTVAGMVLTYTIVVYQINTSEAN